MSEQIVGLEEAFQKGVQKGYNEALNDIQKEINQVRYSFHSISIPIIEGLLKKLEDNK